MKATIAGVESWGGDFKYCSVCRNKGFEIRAEPLSGRKGMNQKCHTWKRSEKSSGGAPC